MAEKMHKLDVKVVALALGIFGVLTTITGIVWHGFLRQPSVLNLLYPGFFDNPVNYLVLIIATFALGIFYGALFAWSYNWVLERQ